MTGRPTSSHFLVLLGIVFFLIGGIIVYLISGPVEDREDEREIRTIDGVECVYNMTDDVIEACVG